MKETLLKVAGELFISIFDKSSLSWDEFKMNKFNELYSIAYDTESSGNNVRFIDAILKAKKKGDDSFILHGEIFFEKENEYFKKETNPEEYNYYEFNEKSSETISKIKKFFNEKPDGIVTFKKNEKITRDEFFRKNSKIFDGYIKKEKKEHLISNILFIVEKNQAYYKLYLEYNIEHGDNKEKSPIVKVYKYALSQEIIDEIENGMVDNKTTFEFSI